MVAAEMTSRNATDVLLFKMAKAGEVERSARGLYQRPGKIGKKERLDVDEGARE
jgi:hypothetical protein